MQLFFAVVLSSGLLLIVCAPKENRTAFFLAAGCFVWSLFGCQSAFMALNTLLVACMMGGCLITGADFGKRWRYALGATLATFVIMSVPAIYMMPDVARERESQPMESLSGRLAYESGAAAKARATEISMEMEQELRRMENLIGTDEPAEVRKLRDLHQSYVIRFVNSDGFGVVRILGQNANTAFGIVGASIGATVGSSYPEQSPPSHQETLPSAYYDDPGLLPAYADPWSQAGQPIPPRASFATLHQGAILDFVSRDKFAYVYNRRNVAGFEPHQMRTVPRLSNPQRWEVARVELVSLLKHPEPMIYPSDQLPRMDRLREIPVRPLDVVEKKMLAELQNGNDVQVLLADNRLRMLGAIRAANQCLKCHDVNRGDLLGAFAYKLRRPAE